jgi:hypothetical protein
VASSTLNNDEEFVFGILELYSTLFKCISQVKNKNKLYFNVFFIIL